MGEGGWYAKIRRFFALLWLMRFSIALALVGIVALSMDQGRELLTVLGTEAEATGSSRHLIKLVVAAMVLAIGVGLCAHVLSCFEFDGREELLPGVRRHLPRALGIAVPVILAIRVALIADASPALWSLVYWLMSGALLFAVLSWVLPWTVPERARQAARVRRLTPAKPGTAARIADLPPLEKLAFLGYATFCLAVTFYVIFNLELAAARFGTAALLLAGVACMLPLGTLLVYAGQRMRFPWFVMLFVYAVAISPYADNHVVRRCSAMHSHHESPTMCEEPVPAASYDRPIDHYAAWLQAHLDARGPAPAGDPADARPLPFIIVAAEGGGIRAAYWTAGVLGYLEDRARERDLGGLAPHVYAISGVSGGSLGAAVFLDAVYAGTRATAALAPAAAGPEAPAAPSADAAPSEPSAAEEAIALQLQVSPERYSEFVQAAKPKSLDVAEVEAALNRRLEVAARQGLVAAPDAEAVMRAAERIVASADQLHPNCELGGVCRAALDVLARDFLGPVLARLLYTDLMQRFVPKPVFDDRAMALEGAWEAAAGYQRATYLDDPLPRLWRDHPRAPLLLLNSTEVETGRRFIVAPVRFDPDAFDATFADAADGLAALGDALPFSTAVHLSARFTYVSPAGRLATDGASSSRETRLVDGGYFENSGAVTAQELLGALGRHLAMFGEEQRPKLKPIVIHISNAPVGAREDLPPVWMRGELGSPPLALAQAREARGRQARRALEDQLNAFAALAHTERPLYVHFRLCQRLQPLPLGWMLDTEARREIEDQIVADCPAAVAGDPDSRVDNRAAVNAVLAALAGGD